jgi:hypothetical protein
VIPGWPFAFLGSGFDVAGAAPDARPLLGLRAALGSGRSAWQKRATAPVLAEQVLEPAERRHFVLRRDEGVHPAQPHRLLPEPDFDDATRVLQELLGSQEMLTDLATIRHREIVAWPELGGQVLAQAVWWSSRGGCERASDNSRRETATWPATALATITPGSQT